MKRYTIHDVISGLAYKRISKVEAKKRYENGDLVLACPCKLRVGSPWNPEIALNSEESFEHMVMYFEYYNCNSETGTYTSFYKIEE